MNPADAHSLPVGVRTTSLSAPLNQPFVDDLSDRLRPARGRAHAASRVS